MGVHEKLFVEAGLGSVLRRRLGGFLVMSRSGVESVCGPLTRAMDDGTVRNSSMRSVSGTGSILMALRGLHTGEAATRRKQGGRPVKQRCW